MTPSSTEGPPAGTISLPWLSIRGASVLTITAAIWHWNVYYQTAIEAAMACEGDASKFVEKMGGNESQCWETTPQL